MVVDIANPSPGRLGFPNAERPPFLERAKPDCVLALAVIHHLLVGANLPMAAIRDLYTQLTRKFLILEFVPTDDVMFRKLIEFRGLHSTTSPRTIVWTCSANPSGFCAGNPSAIPPHPASLREDLKRPAPPAGLRQERFFQNSPARQVPDLWRVGIALPFPRKGGCGRANRPDEPLTQSLPTRSRLLSRKGSGRQPGGPLPGQFETARLVCTTDSLPANWLAKASR